MRPKKHERLNILDPFFEPTDVGTVHHLPQCSAMIQEVPVSGLHYSPLQNNSIGAHLSDQLCPHQWTWDGDMRVWTADGTMTWLQRSEISGIPSALVMSSMTLHYTSNPPGVFGMVSGQPWLRQYYPITAWLATVGDHDIPSHR